MSYRDESTTSKDEWNEQEQSVGVATIHLSDSDPRWGKTVSEGAQFIFHKMQDGTIYFEVYAPNGLNDPSNFDGKFNQTAVKKLKEFLNDKTTY
jgi:hypothetical protein